MPKLHIYNHFYEDMTLIHSLDVIVFGMANQFNIMDYISV